MTCARVKPCCISCLISASGKTGLPAEAVEGLPELLGPVKRKYQFIKFLP